MRAALFWDIDGTLLTTLKAGVFALEEACRSVLSCEVDLAAIEMRGVPDSEIAARILARAGRPDDEESIRRFLDAYEEHLPSRLALRRGGPMPGVVPILSRLEGRPDVVSVLLTGNTRAGAAAKLRHYGLDRFFTVGGFADDGRDRVAIARAALRRAEEEAGGPIPPDRRFVIGDTPSDVLCGSAIEARTIAVATGGYSVEDLQACRPWLCWPALPEPDEFERVLGLPLPAARS